MKLNLSRVHYPITTLGPGNRVGIWFQGCSIRCAGCISRDTWEFDTPKVEIADLMSIADQWLSVADGVTISGGEPFDQAEALQSLLEDIRTRHSGDILVYSGYSFRQLNRHIENMEGLIDALITDPFIADAPQTLPLRGSDNQQLHRLTALGHQRFSDNYLATISKVRNLDVMLDDKGSAWLAGIPKRGDLDALVTYIAAEGFAAQTTQDKSGDQRCD